MRALTTLSVLTLALATLAISAGATPDLTVGTAMGAPNATVNVNVTLAAGGAAVAAQFDITYPSASLTPGTPVAGAALSGLDHEVHSNIVTPGTLRIVLLSDSLTVLPSGVIVTVPFTIAGGATAGDKTLGLTAVEFVEAGAALVPPTGLTSGKVVVTAGTCVLGDIAPNGMGSGTLGLADFVLGRQKLLLQVASDPRDVLCGNVFPGVTTCDVAVGTDNWCPTETGVAAFNTADVVTIRRALLGILTFSCAACPPQGAAGAATLWIPGDLAPLGAPNGRVDVADVVVALRLATGLEPTTPGQLLRGDVAPVQRDGGVAYPNGDGTINVADVVLALRAAVGLETLAWPTRSLTVETTTPAPSSAWYVSVTGFPEWARLAEPVTTQCDGGEVAADVVPGVAGLTCVNDQLVTPGGNVLATVRYTGPRAVDPASLSTAGSRMAAADDEQPLSLHVAVGTP